MPVLWIAELKDPGKPKRFPLIQPSLLIGKAEECDMVLPRPGVSSRHCRVDVRNGDVFVTDLGSTNGTYVDGMRIASETPLKHGAKLKIGEFVATLAPDDAPPPGPSAPAPAPAAGAKDTRRPPARIRGMDAPAATGPADPVQALKQEVHTRLLKELDLKHSDLAQSSDEKIRDNTMRTVLRVLGTIALPANVNRDALVKEVMDEALGLGPLEDLLADAEIDEIMVNRWDSIYVEKRGKIEKTDRRFTSNQQVVNTIRRIIAPIGRRIDESSPMVDARLPDGSRVNAIIAPLALTGPTLTIRKFAQDPFKAADLVGFGSLSQTMASFLQTSVRYRRNVCISGGTGTGKTTLLNVVSMFIPDTERIVTIEDAAELRLPQEHVVSLEAKPPNVEGEGAIPIRKLVINSLRMRPDRIIVGECRGGEALDMLQAMNTGHEGSITTLHANSPRDALSRLETMVLMAGMELPVKAIREQIASAINMIVHLSRMTDGSRKVTKICEVTGMEGEVITMQDLFVFKQTGLGPEGKVQGQFAATGIVPRFCHDLKTRGIDVDLAMFRGQA